MHKDLKNVLLSEEDIQNICKGMGAIITEDYKDRPLVCVGILKGSVMFMADLIKRIDTHLSIDFMDVSSYHGGTVAKLISKQNMLVKRFQMNL